MVLGKRLTWASKDNRFWMGLSLGLTVGGCLYLGLLGLKMFGF